MSPSNRHPWMKTGLGLVSASLLSLVACSHDEPPPQAPVADTPAHVKMPPSKSDLFVVSESVRTKCNLPDTPAESPQFDFDEADIRPRGMGILDGLATCITDGALKGKGITLVGHTDSRGTDAYNKELGMKRAGAARDYLAKKGVADGDVTVKSRGEADATGTTEAGDQLDRRVEIDERTP